MKDIAQEITKLKADVKYLREKERKDKNKKLAEEFIKFMKSSKKWETAYVYDYDTGIISVHEGCRDKMKCYWSCPDFKLKLENN